MRGELIGRWMATAEREAISIYDPLYTVLRKPIICALVCGAERSCVTSWLEDGWGSWDAKFKSHIYLIRSVFWLKVGGGWSRERNAIVLSSESERMEGGERGGWANQEGGFRVAPYV